MLNPGYRTRVPTPRKHCSIQACAHGFPLNTGTRFRGIRTQVVRMIACTDASMHHHDDATSRCNIASRCCIVMLHRCMQTCQHAVAGDSWYWAYPLRTCAVSRAMNVYAATVSSHTSLASSGGCIHCSGYWLTHTTRARVMCARARARAPARNESKHKTRISVLELPS